MTFPKNIAYTLPTAAKGQKRPNLVSKNGTVGSPASRLSSIKTSSGLKGPAHS